MPERYRILRLLGSGSAGAVHLAEDRVAGRLVALKLLDAGDAMALERFRRESLITGRLRSRSIVKVFELGECGGRPFLAMQYVDGGSLADAELGLRPLVAVVRDVAVALAHAHAEGVVHRDIKPENVLIDRRGRAYLTDFGLARDVTLRAGGRLSVDGQISGTPWSMSPEQVRGESVDARSDVYSLGATLYAKLTGRRPFEGEGVIEVLHAVLHDRPTSPRAIARRIPRSLERIVLRCMSKDPADRFQSMRELVLALEGHLAERHRLTFLRRLGAWARRRVRPIEPAPPEKEPAMAIDRETLDQLIYGVGSHVHLLDALEGLDPVTAGALPGGVEHSIFQMVEHMRYWHDIALARIRDESHDAPEHANDGWTAPVEPADAAQWEGAVEGLARGLSALEEHAREAGRSAVVDRNLRMIGRHDSYHLGQAVLLRQLLERWPPPKGGDTW